CALVLAPSACDRTKVSLGPDGGAGSAGRDAGNGGGGQGGENGGQGGGGGNGGAGNGGAGATGGTTPTGGRSPDTGGAAGQMSTTGGFKLVGPPLVSAPTPHGFLLDTVLRAGDPANLRAQLRAEGSAAW